MAFVIAASCSLTPALPGQAASTNEQLIFEILTEDLGFNVAAACGIMANMRAESNFRPGALSGAGSYGLCQWTGGRRSNLYSWCGSHGYDADSIDGQLHFLEHELQSSYPSVYRKLTGVDNTKDGAYDAGWYWCYYFERPANRSGQSARRGNMAAGTYWTRYSVYLTDRWMDTPEGRKYMYRGGTFHTGWLSMDEDTFYLDENGILRTGWFTVDGATYFAAEDGAIVTGWHTIEDSTYYFGLDGSLQKGWVEADGRQIYLDPSGRLPNAAAMQEKAGVTEADISKAAAADESSPEPVLTAPASEPVPIGAKIADAVAGMHSAGAAGTSSTGAIAGTVQVDGQSEGTEEE